jgi:hypothetical protein
MQNLLGRRDGSSFLVFFFFHNSRIISPDLVFGSEEAKYTSEKEKRRRNSMHMRRSWERRRTRAESEAGG